MSHKEEDNNLYCDNNLLGSNDIDYEEINNRYCDMIAKVNNLEDILN